MPATKIEKAKWLKLGLSKFSSHGMQGVNVEQMSKQLDCNKSSFYWHFKTKDNFLNEVIHFWFNNSTTVIYNQISPELSAEERFDEFLTLSFKDKSRKDLMFYLRRASKTKPKLKLLLNEITNRRLYYVSGLIQALGYNKKEAKIKVEILLNFFIGWFEINRNNISRNKQDIDHAKDLVRNFIQF